MFGFFSFLIWPLLIIGVVVFIIRRVLRKKESAGLKEKEWYLQVFLSKEDAISQLFFAFSIFFLGLTLLAFNKDIGEPLSWRTILFLTSLVSLGIGYYFRVIYTLVFGLLGFMGWWAVQSTQWLEGKGIKSIVLLIGLLFFGLLYYVLGRLFERKIKLKRLALIFSILGLVSVTAILFILSTKQGLDLLASMLAKGSSFLASWQLTFSIFVFVISLFLTLFYALKQKSIFKSEVLTIGFLASLFTILNFLPEQAMFASQRDFFYKELSSAGIFWAIVFNLLIFLELVGVIFLGYLRRENWLINFGALAIFLLIFVKYFDWCFTFLDKSLFFIGAGILLLVSGWLMEKGRRYMLSTLCLPKKQNLS